MSGYVTMIDAKETTVSPDKTTDIPADNEKQDSRYYSLL